MADKHGAHQTSDAYVVSLCEDFCKSPSSPVGYMISQKLDMSTLVCGTVNGCGTPVLNMSSRITNVTGNEAGVGGGIVSGVNVGMCKPVDNYATKVRAEGQCLLRHDTIMEMNCVSAESQGNVKGKITYLSFADSLCEGKPGGKNAKPHTNPRKRETREVNGNSVDIYDTDGEGAQYTIVDGKPVIYVGRVSGPGSLEHELKHFEQDGRDGSIDVKLAGKDGKPISDLEAEAEATQKNIDAIDVLGGPFKGMGARYVIKKAYEQRQADQRAADDLIKNGKIEEAKRLAKESENACDYIESAIEKAVK